MFWKQRNDARTGWGKDDDNPSEPAALVCTQVSGAEAAHAGGFRRREIGFPRNSVPTSASCHRPAGRVLRFYYPAVRLACPSAWELTGITRVDRYDIAPYLFF